MQSCPRCQASVEATAIHCPQCGLSLKAHGHPGIPLYRAEQDTYLCSTCLYHQDNTCNFPQRPLATSCTLYQDIHQEPLSVPGSGSPRGNVALWMRRHTGWIAVGGLLLLSLGLVMVQR